MNKELEKVLKSALTSLAEIFKVHKAVLQGGKLDHNMVTKTCRIIDETLNTINLYNNKSQPSNNPIVVQDSKESNKGSLDFCDLFPTIKCGPEDQPENIVSPDSDRFL
jgi:hypothetical protein